MQNACRTTAPPPEVHRMHIAHEPTDNPTRGRLCYARFRTRLCVSVYEYVCTASYKTVLATTNFKHRVKEAHQSGIEFQYRVDKTTRVKIILLQSNC